MRSVFPTSLLAVASFAAAWAICFIASDAFDAPWLALRWADVVAGGALTLALSQIAAQRRGHAIATGHIWVFLSAAVFAIAVCLKYASGVSSDVMLFGLFPASDANGYLIGAVSYLENGRLSEWATRRPFAALHLAGLLALTGHDLRVSLVLLAALCAAGTLLVVAALRARFGPAAAFGAFVSLFPFIYLTLNTTMSESLGFALGCVAFALLVEAADGGKRRWVWIGLALLSVGLMARAGALFVLPALILWCGWRWRGVDSRFSWTTAAVAALAVVGAYAINKFFIIVYGAPGQAAFGNFSFTLYGLAIGGESWTRFFVDFPNAAGLPEGEQAAAAYHAALTHMRAAPFDLIQGIAKRYNDFLINTGWHKYVPNVILRGFVLLLALTGLIHCWRRRREPVPSLLLAGFAGILLSVPFLGDGGPRVFAATHGFSAAFVALGIVAIQLRVASAQDDPRPTGLRFAAVIFAVLVLLPLAVATIHAPNHELAPARDCPIGETHFAGRIVGSRALCSADAVDCPGLRGESLRATNIWQMPIVNEMAGIASPTVIGLAVSPTDWIWLRAHQLPRSGAKIEVCRPAQTSGGGPFDYRP
ncbi:MAG: hypothetical protein ACK4NA_13555 [Alphaproteobacteria bacterium]